MIIVYVTSMIALCFHSVFLAWVVMCFNGPSSVLDQIRLILIYRVTAEIEDQAEDKLFLAPCVHLQDVPLTKKSNLH